MPDIQLHYDCKHCPGEVEQDPMTFEWFHTRIEDFSHQAEPKATYHGITKAVCLNCGKVTTSVTDLEVMNDLDPTCECGVHDTLWVLADGTRRITTGVGDGDTAWFSITRDEVSDLMKQSPTVTLGQFRTMTNDLPNDLPLTAYVPSQGWWVNLRIHGDVVARQKERYRAEAVGEPHDAEMSLVLDAIEDFDTRQF